MNYLNLYLLVILIIGLMSSCGPNESVPTIDTPATYEFNRDGVSTVSFSGQTTRIDMATELISAMQDFGMNSTTLVQMYANQTVEGSDANPFSNADLNASTKSVKSKIAASTDFFSSNTMESAQIKAQFQTWIEAQTAEVFTNKNELASAGKAGQIADGTTARYVNAGGLEYNQAVNKALIGALMVDQICNNYLSTSVLDAGENISNNNMGTTDSEQPYTSMEHKWDEAYGYIFGKSIDTSDPMATLGEGNFLNKYLRRVNDDSDFEGIAAELFDAFKLGRAAIVAGEYTIRDQQAEEIREKLAEVIAIRAIYYLQSGKNALANSNFGGAFHDLSEGLGFVYSLRFLRQMNNNAPYFTNEEVHNFMDQLTTGNGFWDLEPSTLDTMSESIAAKFNFTVAQAAE